MARSKTKASAAGSSGAARGVVVGLTGAAGKLGSALVERLLTDSDVSRVVVFDQHAPTERHAKLRFVPLDLTASTADRTLAAALTEHSVEAVAHLPFLTAPNDPAYAHEVEAIGTIRVLAGVANSAVASLVLASTTSIYGASPGHPNHLDESQPLLSGSRSRFLRDRVEMEQQVAAFRAAQPERRVAVLRFPPIVGPGVSDPLASYLARRFAPVVVGFDPLIQLTHLDDALGAIAQALTTPIRGEFNVGSRGVLPLSSVLQLAGVRALPLPMLGTAPALRLLNALGLTRTPPTLLDFVRYLCVADLRKAERLGLGAQHTIHDALSAFAGARA
jgi:UDP-glucose 4-epimerase